MKKYFQALYQSFGNPALYAQVIHRWRGGGYLYLLVIATLSALVLAGQFSYGVARFYDNDLPGLVKQLPDIAIRDGVVTTNATQPYVIHGADGRTVATIDTTRSESELKKLDGPLLIGKDFLLAQRMEGDWQKVDLTKAGTGNLTVTKTAVTQAVGSMRYLIFLFTPILAGVQWLMLISMTVFAACLSYFVTAYMREEYNFETRLHMGAIALTPPLLVNVLIKTFSAYHLGFWIILALCVLHLYIMIVATRHYLRGISEDVTPL